MMSAIGMMKKSLATGLIVWGLAVQPLTLLAHESPSADALAIETQEEATAVQFDGRLLTARDLQTEQAAGTTSGADGVSGESGQASSTSTPEWKYVPVRP